MGPYLIEKFRQLGENENLHKYLKHMSVKLIGTNFLHPHNGKEAQLVNMRLITNDHVIVDRNDWETVVKFFKDNPDQFSKLITGKEPLKVSGA